MVKTAGKPKGKASAYICFVKTCSEEHKKKFPDEKLTFTEMSKACGEKWKQMPDDKKAPFVRMAIADEKRYNAEMAMFNSVGGSVGAKGMSKRAKKAMKDPNMPKKATTAFFYFLNEKRDDVKAANPLWKITEISKELGRMWKELTAEEKRPYELMNVRDKARHEKEMKAYVGGGAGKKDRGQHSAAAIAAISYDDEGEEGEYEEGEVEQFAEEENGLMDSNEAEEDDSD